MLSQRLRRLVRSLRRSRNSLVAINPDEGLSELVEHTRIATHSYDLAVALPGIHDRSTDEDFAALFWGKMDDWTHGTAANVSTSEVMHVHSPDPRSSPPPTNSSASQITPNVSTPEVIHIQPAIHTQSADSRSSSPPTDSSTSRFNPHVSTSEVILTQFADPCPESPSTTNHSASRIPPELFDMILFYVDVNCSVYYPNRGRETRILRRSSATQNQDDALNDLKACSLVCLHWANMCRKAIFDGALLHVCCLADADMLAHYATRGCPSLVPVHRMIRRLWVNQTYGAERSFLHRLHDVTVLMNQCVMEELNISGPVPRLFPRHLLGTPHWSVPPSTVTPPSLLSFNTINIKNIHVPSLRHVLKYVSHFSRARRWVHFTGLTWNVVDGIAPAPQPRFRTKASQKRAQGSIIISAVACTDNFTLCLYTMMARSDCPLHLLPDGEGQRAVSLMRALWELFPISLRKQLALECYLECGTASSDTSEALTEVILQLRPGGTDYYEDTQTRYPKFSLLFGYPSQLEHSLASCRSHFIAFRVDFQDTKEDVSIDLNALMTLLTTHQTLRVVHFSFTSRAQLQAWMRPTPVALMHPVNDTLTAVVTWEKHDERDFNYHYLAVDPVTFESTGQSWDTDWSVVPSLLKDTSRR